MGIGYTNDKHYNDIGNAIIEKGGSTTKLKPADMANAIRTIPREGEILPTQTKTITPTKETQEATPDSGYTLSKVTVNAIPQQYIDTRDANATANDIVSPKTAYVQGVKLTGTIPQRSSDNVSTGFGVDSNGNITATSTVQAGNYGGGVTKTSYVAPSTLDNNLRAENIANGVKIFDVTGSYIDGVTGEIETLNVDIFNLSDFDGTMFYIQSNELSGALIEASLPTVLGKSISCVKESWLILQIPSINAVLTTSVGGGTPNYTYHSYYYYSGQRYAVFAILINDSVVNAGGIHIVDGRLLTEPIINPYKDTYSIAPPVCDITINNTDGGNITVQYMTYDPDTTGSFEPVARLINIVSSSIETITNVMPFGVFGIISETDISNYIYTSSGTSYMLSSGEYVSAGEGYFTSIMITDSSTLYIEQ